MPTRFGGDGQVGTERSHRRCDFLANFHTRQFVQPSIDLDLSPLPFFGYTRRKSASQMSISLFPVGGFAGYLGALIGQKFELHTIKWYRAARVQGESWEDRAALRAVDWRDARL